MTVQVEGISVSHSAADGGMAIFSMTFTEPGEITFSFEARDTASGVSQAADDVEVVAENAYRRSMATAPHNHT